MVLNTLEWNAENVLACDYFSPLFEHLLKSSRAIEEARKRASGIHAMLSIGEYTRVQQQHSEVGQHINGSKSCGSCPKFEYHFPHYQACTYITVN